ncbi:MAG: HD domain-containing protein [Bdellovibrionia bacterium]
MEIRLILRAATFAAKAHATQLRKTGDQPYINHLLRVAQTVADAGLSEEAIAAALLHDVIEDTDVTVEELSSAFPKRVVHLVELLTEWWDDDASQELKARERPKYYRAILTDPEAVDIKLLDRADNLLDMVRGLPKVQRWATKYLARTEPELAEIYAASKNEYARRFYQSALNKLRLELG